MSPLAQLLEAALFAASRPLSLDELATLDPEAGEAGTRAALAELRAAWAGKGGGDHGVELAEIGDGWQFLTRPEYAETIERAQFALRPRRLSPAALETLAVIAYRQPVTLAEVLAIRGKKSSTALKTLLEKKLVTITGRKPVVGRPILYSTSREFLIHFGLKDISELPTLEEFADMAGGQL